MVLSRQSRTLRRQTWAPKQVNLIFACDVSEFGLGRALIAKVAPHIDVVKLGLEAMTAESEFGVSLAVGLRSEAFHHSLDVMWDMKIHDVANTMSNATKNIVRYGSKLFTLHATASDQALEAVAMAAEGTDVLPVAVTVLTDLDNPRVK